MLFSVCFPCFSSDIPLPFRWFVAILCPAQTNIVQRRYCVKDFFDILSLSSVSNQRCGVFALWVVTLSLYSFMITAFLFGLSLFSAVSNRRAQSVSREYVFRFHGQGGQEYLEPGGPGTYSTQSTGQWPLNLFFHQHRTTCLFIFIYPVRSCYRNSYRSRAGAVVRALASHRCGPGSILSSVHMWAKFVVGSYSAPRGFSPGYSGFPLSLKTSTSKFQFDPECLNA